jgi:hypothetical protein
MIRKRGKKGLFEKNQDNLYLMEEFKPRIRTMAQNIISFCSL